MCGTVKKSHLKPSMCLRQRERRSKAHGLSWHWHRLLRQAEGAGCRFGGLHRRLHRLIGQEQKTSQSYHLQHLSAGGAGESVPEDALPWRVRPGAAGPEDRAHRGSGSGVCSGNMNYTFLFRHYQQKKVHDLNKTCCRPTLLYLKGLVPES